MKRLALWGALVFATPAAAQPAPERIQHIIVISLENHSFDNIFGRFPGADGIQGAVAAQVDDNGKPYATLPPVPNDTRFPTDLPNRPFPIEQYITEHDMTPDLLHRFYQQQAQIDGGKMDRFAAISDAGGLTMGYYDGLKTQLGEYAQHYTLADHFFHAAFGGSFLNHMWLVCACTPLFPDAPPGLRAVLDAEGKLLHDGAVTPDGFAVNTLFSRYAPHPAGIEAAKLLPPQEAPTIGDRLSQKHISWAWYAGGWNDAAAGHPDPLFQFHHQPFSYFKSFAEGTPARAEHLKDEADFLAALKDNTLPAVAFYKPLGEFNLHPGYADIVAGDAHLAMLLHAIEQSGAWASSVVIVTFDENGGYWDHVAPPAIDRWGPGMRVPTLVISPFARRHFVDHTPYDTTSILKFIETRFGLAPLTERDAKANDIGEVLE